MAEFAAARPNTWQSLAAARSELISGDAQWRRAHIATDSRPLKQTNTLEQGIDQMLSILVSAQSSFSILRVYRQFF